MLYILRYHGLVPVPVDLSPETLAMDIDVLDECTLAVQNVRMS